MLMSLLKQSKYSSIFCQWKHRKWRAASFRTFWYSWCLTWILCSKGWKPCWNMRPSYLTLQASVFFVVTVCPVSRSFTSYRSFGFCHHKPSLFSFRTFIFFLGNFLFTTWFVVTVTLRHLLPGPPPCWCWGRIRLCRTWTWSKVGTHYVLHTGCGCIEYFFFVLILFVEGIWVVWITIFLILFVVVVVVIISTNSGFLDLLILKERNKCWLELYTCMHVPHWNKDTKNT